MNEAGAEILGVRLRSRLMSTEDVLVRDEAGIFLMIYLATRPDRVYVLHCFQKKTQRTSRADLELAMKRFKLIAR
jgi:phage-related protein